MSFLQLVRREMHGSLPKLLSMSALGGIATASVLAAINAGLQGKSGLWAPMLFLFALLLFIKTQYYVTITTTAEIEAIIHKIRLRLMDQIRHSELLSIEGIGRSRIFSAITGDTAILTQASNMLLDGFKEIKLNNTRSDDLFDDAVDVSRTAANIKIKSQAETFKLIVTSQISMYVLLGAVVFIAPQFSGELGGAALTKTTTALMFIVGACFGLVQSIPVLLNANAAADRIEQLEVALRATVSSKPHELQIRKRFDKIEMRNIEFRYFDRFSDVSFKIGPIDFDLQSGELVFITGGNGSGKSTFLRVLSGLYPPDSGEITLDGMPVDENTRDAYRNLMSAIFFDYHLFQRLYGIEEPEPGEVDRLLAQFRLGDKTGLVDGQFRTLDLSGGQRRRLALIVSLLEKRPILLLDEWTAEQDPEFRRKFYDELLPNLMKAGATIVVITHDDRYLDELDLPARRIRMDEGRIVEQRLVQKS
jgi:putative ATP-binding cassette transporter